MGKYVQVICSQKLSRQKIAKNIQTLQVSNLKLNIFSFCISGSLSTSVLQQEPDRWTRSRRRNDLYVLEDC